MKLVVLALILSGVSAAQTVGPGPAGSGGSSPTTLTTCGPFTMAQVAGSNNTPLACVSSPGSGKAAIVDSFVAQCAACTTPNFYDADVDGSGLNLVLAPAGSPTIPIVTSTCTAYKVLISASKSCPVSGWLTADIPPPAWSGLSNQALVLTLQSFTGSGPGFPAVGKPATMAVGSTAGTGYSASEQISFTAGSCTAFGTITQSGGVPSAITPAFPPSGYSAFSANVIGCTPTADNATVSQPSLLVLGVGGTGYAANDTGEIGMGQCTTPGAYKILSAPGGVAATFQALWQPTGCNGIGTLNTQPDGPQPGGGDSGFTLTETDSTDSGTLLANLSTVTSIDGGLGNIYVTVLYHTVTVH